MRYAPSAAGRIALLSLAIAVGQLATSLYLPSLPAMGAELGIGPGAAGWTLTAFYLGFALSGFAAGPLADRWGRRPVLLGGLAVFLAGTLVCALAASLPPLLLGRVVQGAGAGGAPVVGRAALRDVQGEGDGTRGMMWLGIAMAVAPALGPPLGGLLQQGLGWRWTFWVLAAGGLMISAAALLLLDETLPVAARWGAGGLLRRCAALLADGAFRRNVGALSSLFAALGAFFAAGPFLLIGLLGFSPLGYGLLNLANVAAYLAGSLVTGRLSRGWPSATLVRRGTLLALVGGAAMVGLAALGIVRTWALLGPVMVLTAGFGLVLPAATAGALERQAAGAGLASALLGLVQAGAAAGGTAVAGVALGLGGTLPVAGVFLGLTALAALFAHGLREDRAA